MTSDPTSPETPAPPGPRPVHPPTTVNRSRTQVPSSQAPQPSPETTAALQDALSQLNASDPPAIDVPPVLGNMRHACPAAHNATKAIDCKEKRIDGLSLLTEAAGPTNVGFKINDHGEAIHEADETSLVESPSGSPYPPNLHLASLLYKEGKCKACGLLARSLVGRAVLTSSRPPLEGRVARS